MVKGSDTRSRRRRRQNSGAGGNLTNDIKNSERWIFLCNCADPN